MGHQTIFRSDLVSLREHRWDSWRAGRHPGGHPRTVIMVRRGLYSVDGAGELVVASTQMAAIYDGHSSYVLDFPVPDGADCTQIEGPPDLMDEAFPNDRYSCPVSPGLQLAHVELCCGAKRGLLDALEAEERTLDLLAVLSAGMGRTPRPRRLSRAAQRRMAHVKALMVAEPQVNHQLADLAALAGCSPFHFARLFREVTGSPVRALRIRLRLAMAMGRIAEGAEDLSDLAFECGFASHSHMTSSFQQVLNRTPSQLREHLGSRRLLKAARRLAA